MKKLIIPSIVIMVAAALSNVVSPVLRPPVSGIGFFMWGASLYPFVKDQQPMPLARYLVIDGRLVLGKYLLAWIGVAILFMSVVGMVSFR